MKNIKINALKFGTFFVLLVLLVSCNETITIPKPPTYLRLNLPEHEYVLFSDDCPYEFEAAKIFKIR